MIPRVDVTAVNLQLLKALLTPELKLAPGRALMARVVRAETAVARGALSIAGNVIEAELPKRLGAGDEVKLLVREVSPEKVVLSLSQEGAAVAQPPVATLPGGGRVRVSERDQTPDRPDAAGVHTLAIRYDAPSLGPVDLRFALDPASLRVTVAVAPGQPYEAARAAAAKLGDALSSSVGRTVSVSVTPRQDPVEIYA